MAAAALGATRGSLPVYFDVLEGCSGALAPFSTAYAMLGLVVTYLDILGDDFYMWIKDLARARRILHLHLGPP